MIKAWFVRNEKSETDFATVVFAETRGKAHSLAMRTEACEDAEWVNIYVRRVPTLDKEYRGRWEMDWFNVEDRIALVRDANFVCTYEMDDADCDCEDCPATEWCDRYERMHEEVNND